VRDLLVVRPWTLLGGGLFVSAATALVPLVAGLPPLDQRAWSLRPPLLGDVKVTSATVFDSGVFLIVVGLVLMVLEGLGDDPSPEHGTHVPADATAGPAHEGRLGSEDRGEVA
jgi:multicomponent Na+:H+ antiporter subunit A